MLHLLTAGFGTFGMAKAVFKTAGRPAMARERRRQRFAQRKGSWSAAPLLIRCTVPGLTAHTGHPGVASVSWNRSKLW